MAGDLAGRVRELAAGRHARRVRPLRELRAGSVHVNARPARVFCSNDYLGLSQDPRVIEAAIAATRQYGSGSTGSAFISGYTVLHEQLETELAAFLGRERALLFPAGYMANLGTLGALARPGDRILLDRLCHASLIDAARASGARWQRYRHNRPDDLQRLLDRPCRGLGFIVSDGVFSMDGDIAPLRELAALAGAADHILMVDDAHGIGVLGPAGGGSLAGAGIPAQAAPLLTGTLGKALAAGGAFLAGPADLLEAVLQEARTGIYTTALAPALAGAALAALRIIRDEPEHVTRLAANVSVFRMAARAAGLPLTPSDTPIQPLVLGSASTAVDSAAALLEAGFHVQAIRPPTVPAAGSRLRITLSAGHCPDDIQALVAAIADCLPARARSA